MTSRKFFSDLLKFADKDARAQKHIYNYERGLLTHQEATQQVIDLYINRGIGADDKVQEWYMSEFPDDILGCEIDYVLTFDELYHAMKMNDDFYDTIGVNDSIVRERIFHKMSCLYNVPYQDIYDLWLRG